MKIAKYVSILLFAILSACGGQDESYKEFIGDAPIVYLQRYETDSIQVQNGRERVRLTLPALSDPRIEFVKVTWSSGYFEKEVPVIYKQSTVVDINENLPEGLYDFVIANYTKDGLYSLISSIDAETYGKTYESYLRTRNIIKIDIDVPSGNTELTLPSLSDSIIVATEVKWAKKDGTQVSQVFPNTLDNKILLENLRMENNQGEFSLRTHAKPQPDALDVFYSEWKTIQFDVEDEYKLTYIDRKNPEWTIRTSYPNLVEGTNGSPSCMIDGNNSSFFSIRKPGFPGYETEVPPGTESYFIVDLQTEQTFDQILWRHRNSSLGLRAWGISLFGSHDGVNFTQIANNKNVPGEFDGTVMDAYVYFDASTYRYLKVQFTRWNTELSTAIQIAEINLGNSKTPTGKAIGVIR